MFKFFAFKIFKFSEIDRTVIGNYKIKKIIEKFSLLAGAQKNFVFYSLRGGNRHVFLKKKCGKMEMYCIKKKLRKIFGAYLKSYC
jgi:hypothetical protein